MRAVSCIVRDHPQLLQEFVARDGVTMLAAILYRAPVRLATKVAYFVASVALDGPAFTAFQGRKERENEDERKSK